MASSEIFYFYLLLVFVVGSIASASEVRETKMALHMQGKRDTEATVAGVQGSCSEYNKFGTTVVIDDLVTEEAQIQSNVVGRAKGVFLYADASGVGSSAPFLISIVFENDKNGSYNSLQLQGVLDEFYGSTPEASVVGGTGRFRFARGYAMITTEAVHGVFAVLKFDLTFRLSDVQDIYLSLKMSLVFSLWMWNGGDYERYIGSINNRNMFS